MSTEEALESAYLHTTYWVQALPRPIALRIGERSPALDRLLAHRRTRHWAFVTAWNPRSRRLPAWRNVARQRELVRALRRSGYVWLPGLGEGDDPDWGPEPSVLVLGIPEQDAVRLARRFSQNAIVAGRLGSAARLLLCGKQDCNGQD